MIVDNRTSNGGSAEWGAIGGTLGDQTDLQLALNAKEPSISAGTTAQYWKGDKSWASLLTDVMALVLTGLSVATATPVVATDTVLVALGKLQGQIDAMNALNSFVKVSNASAYGSESNCKIVCFSTLEDSAGTDVSRVTNATEGDYILINTTGLYWVNLAYTASATATIAGVSLNVSATNRLLTIGSLTVAQGKRLRNFATPNRTVDMGDFIWLTSGDKLRAHTDGATLPTASDLQYMSVRLMRKA